MEDSIFFSTRLRNRRTKERLIKQAKEKYIRKQYKRSTEIYKEMKEVPLVPLAVPYQLGFKRYFILTEHVTNEKDVPFFEGILKKLNNLQYSNSRKFEKKRKRHRKRVYVPIIQKLNTISTYHFEGPSAILDDHERQYFRLIRAYNPQIKSFYEYYEFIEPWRYRLIVKPNMITHYRPLIPELEIEQAEIRKFLYSHKNNGLLIKKFLGGSYSWRSAPTFKNPFRKQKFSNNRNSALEIAETIEGNRGMISKKYF